MAFVIGFQIKNEKIKNFLSKNSEAQNMVFSGNEKPYCMSILTKKTAVSWLIYQ